VLDPGTPCRPRRSGDRVAQRMSFLRPMKTPLQTLVLVVAGLAWLGGSSVGAAEAIAPDLQKIASGVGAKLPPKGARWEPNAKGKPALFTGGAIWLDGVNFTDGTIECDILGKSSPRGSNFLGLAFRGVDDATFDCVYFRPFNFRAENPENAAHAVQYISHPQWTWQKLRAEKTGQYEKPIAPPPDGDAWFHAKIVVAGRKVSVFVNDATKPALEVETLNDRKSGRIAIWGGDAGEGGYFANLKITPSKP
jgi:hypothetical protein